MNLDDDTKVVAAARVPFSEEDEDDAVDDDGESTDSTESTE